MAESASPRVVSLGSINVDRVYRLDRPGLEALTERPWFPERGATVAVGSPPEVGLDPDAFHHGGKGANQATAAAAAGAPTAMLGLVGPDHEEYGVVSRLAADGVGVTGIETVSAPTGTADVFVGPDGDTRILVCPGANDAVGTEYVGARYETIAGADCLLLQNEIPVEPVATLLERLGDERAPPTVVLDPGPPEGVERLLATGAVDYFTPNEREAAALGDLSGFRGTSIETHGSGPVLVEGRDGRLVVSPPSVDPVDATGAGDVLNGYLAAGLAAGDSLREALVRAVAAASRSTLVAGARASVPDRRTVERFRTERGPSVEVE